MNRDYMIKEKILPLLGKVSPFLQKMEVGALLAGMLA
jgi:hypothetical protein